MPQAQRLRHLALLLPLSGSSIYLLAEHRRHKVLPSLVRDDDIGIQGLLALFTRRMEIIDTSRIMHFCPNRIDQSTSRKQLFVSNFHSTRQAMAHRNHRRSAHMALSRAVAWRIPLLWTSFRVILIGRRGTIFALIETYCLISFRHICSC